MTQQLSFLCIGSSSQDVYLYNVDGLAPVCVNPEDCFYNIHLGDKIYVNKVDFMTGGGASNASVTFARGGQKAYFICAKGKRGKLQERRRVETAVRQAGQRRTPFAAALQPPLF